MIRRIPAAVIVLLIVGACAGSSNHATDMPQLIEQLTTAGVAVEEAGEAPALSVPGLQLGGRVLIVNEELVTVLVYEDAGAARDDAKKVSPDGFQIASNGGASIVDWIAPPHFYRSGPLIVLYVGRVDAVTEALEAALGPQFAGR